MKKSLNMLLAGAVALFSVSALAGNATLMDKVQAVSEGKAPIMSLSQSDYDAYLDHVEKGETTWIKTTPALAKYTDAGYSEDMSISLATALPLNPVAVLSVIDEDNYPLSAKRVCSAPFIDTDRQQLDVYLRKTKAVLHKVTTPALKEKRDACLKILNIPVGQPVQ